MKGNRVLKTLISLSKQKEYLEIIVLEKKPFLKLELIIILAIFMKIWIC